MKKTLTITALAVAALSLSACSSGVDGNPNDKRENRSFDSGKAGKADQSLPNWVPDEATGIKQVIRTTAGERIMMLENAKNLPETCAAVPEGQKPTSGPDSDSNWGASESSNGPATLSADWWPNGIEQKAKNVCGRWWVTIDGDKTYAYAPETTQMLQKIKDKAK